MLGMNLKALDIPCKGSTNHRAECQPVHERALNLVLLIFLGAVNQSGWGGRWSFPLVEEDLITTEKKAGSRNSLQVWLQVLAQVLANQEAEKEQEMDLGCWSQSLIPKQHTSSS